MEKSKGLNYIQGRIMGLVNKIEEFNHPIKEADECGEGNHMTGTCSLKDQIYKLWYG